MRLNLDRAAFGRRFLAWPLARLLLAVPWMLTPGRTEAQQRGTVELVPTVGAAFFLNDAVDPMRTDGFDVRSSFEHAFTIGFGVGVNVSRSIGLDATFLYTPTELSSSTEGVSVGLEANQYIAGVSARFALPWIASAGFSPYVAAGGGVKGYDGLIGTRTNAMWNFGFGTYVPLGAFQVRLDMRDYMSRFGKDDGRRFQNDLLVTAGLVVSL